MLVLCLTLTLVSGCSAKDYRSISVEEVTGDVKAKGEKKDGDLLKGEHLYSGDFVTIAQRSGLTMCADKNKFLYADENTAFGVEAAGDRKSRNLKFAMTSGSTLHELKEKLGENDTYEVDTPNSTMAVRGTTFRVTVYTGPDGMNYTLLEVESGSVLVRLKTDDGTYTGEEKMFNAGESALIRGNSDISEFVPGNFKDATWILDYKRLPKENVERLVTLLEKGAYIPEDYAHDHVLSDWTVEKEPGCETEGTEERICTLCGKVMETRAIEATGHKIGDWEIETAPGCETEGTEVKKCENCGKVTETRTVKATGHTPGQWIITKEPTCTAKGEHEKKCTVCGVVLQTGSINAAGHKYGNWNQTAAPSCEAAGQRERTCSVCGQKATETVAALGHDWTFAYVTRTATCVVSGEDYYTCSRCGRGKTENTGKDPNNHTGNWSQIMYYQPQMDPATGNYLDPNDVAYFWRTCQDCGAEQRSENGTFD